MSRQEKKKIADPKIVTGAVEDAEEAGLRYVSDDQPFATCPSRRQGFDGEWMTLRSVRMRCF